MSSVLDWLGDAGPLFFINGLAFFALGLSVALEAHSTHWTLMGKRLPLLAAWGLVASLGNWLQMFLVLRGSALPPDAALVLDTVRLLCLVLSSLLLAQFGLQLLVAHRPGYAWLRTGFWVLAAVFLGVVATILSRSQASHGDAVAMVETWTRNLIYAPGLALTSFAFLTQRSVLQKIKLHSVARDCLGAAIVIGLKMVLSGLMAVPILSIVGAPRPAWLLALQVLRTLTTVAFAFFVVRILRGFESERRQRLDSAIQDQLRAKEEALAVQGKVCAEIERWGASMANMVQTVSSAISQTASLEETLQTVLRETIRLIGLKSGAVFLLDEQEPVLRLVAQEALPEWLCDHLREVRVGDGLAGWVAGEEKVLVVEDTAQDPRPFIPRGEEVVKFYVGVPLRARGKVVGVMHVSGPERHELSAEQIALLVAAGQQLGVAIENSRLYERVRSLATAEERNRVARSIHDSLCQLLGYLNLKAASAEHLLANGQTGRAQEELVEVKRIAQDAYADAREAIFSLRTTASEVGFLPALRAYLDEFQAHYRLKTELILDGVSLADLGADASMQVSCIIQEALTNVRKHASATRVCLRFEPCGSGVQVSIDDDGRGFDPEQTAQARGLHFGLSVMRERATSIGGKLTLSSGPGEGTRVLLWVPGRGRVIENE